MSARESASDPTECEIEIADLIARMNSQQRRAWIYLGRLYLERQAAPSAAVSEEIHRIEREIRDGLVPSVPRTQ